MAKRNRKWNLVFILSCVFIAVIIQMVLRYNASKSTNLFPQSLREVTKKYCLLMSPSEGVYWIWVLIFVWQIALVLLGYYGLIRNNPEAKILTSKFFVIYGFHIAFDIASLFCWSKEKLAATLAMVGLRTVLIGAAFWRSCYDLYQYKKNVTAYHCTAQERVILTRAQRYNTGQRGVYEKWGYRVIVLNGTLFYAAWSSFESFYHLAIVTKYDLHTSNLTASLIGLSLAAVVMIGLFMMEYFVIKRYTKYTLSAYIAFAIVFAAIFYRICFVNKAIGIFSMMLFMVSGFFAVLRLLIICIKRKRHQTERSFF